MRNPNRHSGFTTQSSIPETDLLKSSRFQRGDFIVVETSLRTDCQGNLIARIHLRKGPAIAIQQDTVLHLLCLDAPCCEGLHRVEGGDDSPSALFGRCTCDPLGSFRLLVRPSSDRITGFKRSYGRDTRLYGDIHRITEVVRFQKAEAKMYG